MLVWLGLVCELCCNVRVQPVPLTSAQELADRLFFGFVDRTDCGSLTRLGDGYLLPSARHNHADNRLKR